jgi:hypothetical protein
VITSVRSTWLQRGLARLGMDAHVLATLLFRFWSVLAGGCTVLLIPFFLDSVQQGYYYTFASILALQIFFELGMGQVVIQIVAHEAVHLRQAADGSYQGEPEYLARVAQLKQLLARWYLPAALLFLLAVNVVGLLFFRNGALSWPQWMAQWCLLVGATAVNFYFSWKLAMVEGFALVRDIGQLRLKQSMAGYLLMWTVLLLGGGLWVVAVVPLTAVLFTALWLRMQPAAGILAIKANITPAKPISWRRDIFPFQWRVAVSWVSGYFIFHLFTPLLFRNSGAAEAGRLGLAMTVFSAISTIGMSWVNANAPTFSILIARHQSAELLKLFKNVATRSILVTAAMACAVLGASWLATQCGLSLMQRVASIPTIAYLAFVTMVNSVIFASAVFMRAHREEPMLTVSVVGGILTALAAWLGSMYGATAMMQGYVAVTTLIGLPWTLLLLRGFLARHREPKPRPPT